MHEHGKRDVVIDERFFELVYETTYGRVRIFKVVNPSQKSKNWAADPANRECDAPGSWYCPGKYPPALDFVFEAKKDFQQLEDFNAQKDEDHDEYQKQYMQKMAANTGVA